MKKKKGTRGAISVFLAMILVPCIVVSSVFVDLSRVHLSKAATESSADLALNSLLTNYDADLSDWYGMVASCQNIDEFYTISAQYFLRTISSQNLSEDEIILLSDYYAAATNDDTIYDLLQVESQTDVGSIVSPVEGANLTNTSLLKDQVVEFMKYRAPIQIAEDIFSMIKNEDGTTSEQAAAVLESEENEDLVDDKQEFYAAEGELMTAAFYTYWAIRDYYDAASSRSYSNAKLQEYANKINGYKTAYAYIHNGVVKNLFNTSDLTSKYTRVNISLDNYNSTYTKTSSDVYSRKVTEDGVTTYYIDGDDITSLLDDLEQEITDFNTAKTNFVNAASSLTSNLPGTGENNSNAVQWWLQMHKAVNSGSNSHTKKVKTAAQNMLKAYSKVLAIKDCTLGDEIPSDWETRFNELTGEVSSLQSKYLKKNVTDNNDSYLKAVKKLEDVSNDNLSVVNQTGSGVWVTVDGQSKTIKDAIPYISTQLSNLKTELEDRIDELDIAIDGDGDDVKSLTKLKSLAREYNSTFSTWSSTADTTYKANGQHTQMATEDQTLIDSMTLQQDINESSVNALSTRLKNIRSQLQTLVDAIDDMKYGNKKVVDIKDYSTFKGQTNNKVSSGSIPLKNKEIDNYAGSTFGQLFKPTSSQVVTLSNTTGNTHNPDINPAEGNTVATPALFVYMHREFKDTTREKFSSAEKDKSDTEAAQDAYVEGQKEAASEYRGGGTNIVKEFSDGNKYSAGSGMLKTVIGLFKDIINGDLDKIRDDIYVTSYITNMFSYATYDYEAMYELLEDEDKKNLTPATAKTTYEQKVMGTETNPEPGTWYSTEMTDSYNKSLTNKMINKANNAAYLAEVEYILYGKDTNKANIKEAFGEIYTFRLLLNTVSSFQHFWISSNNDTAGAIEVIAGMISMATGYIIPSPVIKAVMLPILAAVETCNDNSRLAKGMPVELYKTKYEDWWISFARGTSASGYGDFFSKLKNAATGTGKNQDKGLFYSDYLTIFVYSGLSGGGSVEDDMYERMAEIIQANMRKLIGEGSTYSMSKCQVYFKLNATLRVKPLMITLPIFNDYENNLDTATDWCTYTISTVRGYN